MALSWIFILALLFFGNLLARRSRFLLALNFPGSLVGGIIGGVLILILRRSFSYNLEIPDGPRDLLLVVFFICSGLVMTISSWKEAGRSLLPLSIICIGLIVLQNVVAIVAVMLFGQDPIYGVMNGSVAYVGGLGSAVAWGQEASLSGATNAIEVGVVAATLGLLVSALICGPYVSYVMRREKLDTSVESKTNGANDAINPKNLKPEAERRFTESEIVLGFLLVALSLFMGDLLRDLGKQIGFLFPRFLTAMVAGIVLSMALELSKTKIDRALMDKLGSICLNIFIVMTLSGLELWKLKGDIGTVLIIAVLQTVVTIIVVHFTVFRLLGRNYESLAMAGGFVGFILGSFAVAMATVRNTESIYGPLPRAVLLVTLVGGAVSNIANALITLLFFRLLL